MPLTVRVESETGELVRQIFDSANVLSSFDAPSSCILRFIDPWGDTTLNQLQIPVFVLELDSVETQANLTSSARSVIEEVKQLAQLAMSEVHLYIKIEGD